MKLFLIILLHIILLALSVPFDSGDSIVGLFGFMFRFPLTIFLIVLVVVDIVRKHANKRLLLILDVLSLGFVIISIIWGVLAFDAIDFSSFAEVSIWYRLGPAFSFTIAVLLLIDNFVFVRFRKSYQEG